MRRSTAILLASLAGAGLLTCGALAAFLYPPRKHPEEDPKGTRRFLDELVEADEDFERELQEFVDEQGYHMRVPLVAPPFPLELPAELGGGTTPVAFYPNSYNRGKFDEHGEIDTESWHRAVDLRVRRRTPLQAVRIGVVTDHTGGKQYNSVAGHCVRYVDDVGVEHFFSHLDSKPLVRVGEVVKPFQIIAFAGNSGNAEHTPCHVHYQQKLHVPKQGFARYPNPYVELRAWWPENVWRGVAPSHCTKDASTCLQCLQHMEVA